MGKLSYWVLEKRYNELRQKRDVLIDEIYALRRTQKANIKYIQKLEGELIEYKLLLNELLKKE